MFEREIIRYDTLLKEYRQQVIDKFNAEDLKEYNEILFSAHSCAIEGNTFSVDDTRALKEKDAMRNRNVSQKNIVSQV